MGRQGETDKGTSGGMPGTEMRGVAAEDCSEREARRLRFTNIQRYTDTEIHGSRDTRIQGYTDTDIYGYRDTEIEDKDLQDKDLQGTGRGRTGDGVAELKREERKWRLFRSLDSVVFGM